MTTGTDGALLRALVERLFGGWKTSLAGVAMAGAIIYGLLFGSEALDALQKTLLAAGSAASAILLLMRDPGQPRPPSE